MPIGPRLNIASAPKCQRPCHAADVCTWVFCHEVRIDSEGNDPPETQEAGNVKTDTRPFAIVMLPPSEEGCGIALVGLRSDGALDYGRNFLFVYRPTRGAQKAY